MPIMFNTLLREAGFPLCDVRLVRHADTRPEKGVEPYASKGHKPYDLWINDLEKFEQYQEIQFVRDRALLDARYWAVFLGAAGKTLFAGIYDVRSRREVSEDLPAGHVWSGRNTPGTRDAYDLALKRDPSALGDLIGRLYVDWGPGRPRGHKGERAWVQKAEKHDKPATELLPEAVKRPGLRGARATPANSALVRKRR